MLTLLSCSCCLDVKCDNPEEEGVAKFFLNGTTKEELAEGEEGEIYFLHSICYHESLKARCLLCNLKFTVRYCS